MPRGPCDECKPLAEDADDTDEPSLNGSGRCALACRSRSSSTPTRFAPGAAALCPADGLLPFTLERGFRAPVESAESAESAAPAALVGDAPASSRQKSLENTPMMLRVEL
jgi:hypothetical protein